MNFLADRDARKIVWNKEHLYKWVEQTNSLPKEGNFQESIAREALIHAISQATDSYFYSCALKRGGYKNMGEINYDATVDNDPDAKFLQKLYDALWAKEAEIEEQIDKMSLEELLNLDIEKLTKTEYDKVLKELEASIESSTSNSDNQEGSTNE